MKSDFRFYFHGNDTDLALWGLLDTVDNHFMIQSNDLESLYETRRLIRSKTLLEIASMDQDRETVWIDENNNQHCVPTTDNEVIERWGVADSSRMFRVDPLTSSAFAKLNTKSAYFQNIPSVKLQQTSVPFDNFKLDLQKQIFLFYTCAQVCQNFCEITPWIEKIAQLSCSYDHAVEMMLNFELCDRKLQGTALKLLAKTQMLYE
jgi:hypothetical protein